MNTLPALPPKSALKRTNGELEPEAHAEGRRSYFLDAVPPVAADDDDDDDEEEGSVAEIPIEEFEDISDSEGEETLERAVRNITERNFFGGAASNVEPTKFTDVTVSLTKRPEVIDDYIRNFLSSKGLLLSLEAFQNEWYEFQQKGKLSPEDVTIVPDVYLRNQELADALQKLRVDVDNYKEIATKARATYDKLRKERDFHRMHHKRVVQEKNKLISDIKRLKKHYEGYEPMLKQLQHKYEVAMKEKMLTKLERDRLAGRSTGIEQTKSKDRARKNSAKDAKQRLEASSPTSSATGSISDAKPAASRSKPSKESVLPTEDRINPHLTVDYIPTKIDRLKQVHVIKAHSMAVSGVKFHPRKHILATVSDDKSWKMFAFPSGELIMSGEGHKDWIGDCDFHPRGTHLATSSGDGTVKIWDFSKGLATLTLSDHTQAVWGCAFHDTGDFLASCSMDHTAKLWDLHTGKCRQTFRGHADSVNHVAFQPYSNTIVTCSGDKTISLWDCRTGLCSQTLYGHMNAINSVIFSAKSDLVASCDADGVVKFWDIRNVSELDTIDFGPHPANKLTIDPASSALAVASNDGNVKLFNIRNKTVCQDLVAHDDAVQAISFDRTGEFLVTGGSDCVVRIFQ